MQQEAPKVAGSQQERKLLLFVVLGLLSPCFHLEGEFMPPLCHKYVNLYVNICCCREPLVWSGIHSRLQTRVLMGYYDSNMHILNLNFSESKDYGFCHEAKEMPFV